MQFINDIASRYANFIATNIADFNVDMMYDMPEEYKTFKDVENVMNNTISDNNEMAEQYIEDLIKAIRSELAMTKIKVKEVTYTDRGIGKIDYIIRK